MHKPTYICDVTMIGDRDGLTLEMQGEAGNVVTVRMDLILARNIRDILVANLDGIEVVPVPIN
jgi:hypothetical protein